MAWLEDVKVGDIVYTAEGEEVEVKAVASDGLRFWVRGYLWSKSDGYLSGSYPRIARLYPVKPTLTVPEVQKKKRWERRLYRIGAAIPYGSRNAHIKATEIRDSVLYVDLEYEVEVEE